MNESVKQFDAAVIGGGVIGCAIAWRLAQAGMQVVVIERGEVCREASYAAGGMLAPQSEADKPDEFFRLAMASRAIYADFARELRETSGIDIEYRSEGTLYLAFTDDDERELDHRRQWQQAAGLNVKRLDAGCVRKLEPLLTDRLRWALKFPDDHQVNNRRLGIALYQACLNAGVQISTHTEARRILTESRAGKQKLIGVKTSCGEIKTGNVVIAAGSWSGQVQLGDLSANRLNVEPVRGQMVSVEMPVTPLRHVVYSRAAYLVPRLGGFLIAGSTTEHAGYDNRVTAGGIASIIERASEIVPGFRELAITETWAGLRPKAGDDLPVLGEDANISGLVYATAHYRNGILLTPITARAIGDLITKGESGIDLAPFGAQRFAL